MSASTKLITLLNSKDATPKQIQLSLLTEKRRKRELRATADVLFANYERPWMYDKQIDALFRNVRYAICEASTKAGKAQPLDALISTPGGWVRMGDVRIGHIIHGVDGPTKITGIYPQGKHRVYRVTMSDGSSTEASGDHLWEVRNSRNVARIMTTEELAARPSWSLRRSYVPQHAAVEYEQRAALPIEPWLLGYLLGDGYMKGTSLEVAIGMIEVEQQEQVRSAIGECTLRHRGRADWRINKPVASYRHPIIQQLKAMGLWGCGSFTKFVPEAYLFASIDDRLAMVQGLLDSDGSVNKHGQPILEQCSPRISQAFVHLVRSLGGVVRSSVKTSATGNPVYNDTVSIQNPSSLFRMTRKAEKCRSPKKPVKKTFRSIEFIGEKECQCIRVDAADHLYLTDGFIATHNTHGCINWLIEEAMCCEDGQNVWWVAPVYLQAEIAYKRMKRALPQAWYKANDSDMTILLVNGCMIHFKSAEKPDNLYGEDVYAVVIDEASRVREEAWHAIRSTLTATRGRGRIIGNIKGRKNWFYQLARKAEAGEPDYHYSKLIAADAVAAGILSAEEIEAARRDLPLKVFNELYMAIPSDDGGNPFGLQAIAECTRSGMSLRPVVAWGVDLAKSIDWTSIIGLDDAGNVAYFDRFQMPWEQTEERLMRMIGTAKNVRVDSTGVGDPIVERMQKKNPYIEGFKFTSTSKQQIMEGLAVAIQNRLVTLLEGVMRMEHEAYEFEYTRTGVRYTAPPGQHDDTVCAMALAYSVLSMPKVGQGFLDYYEKLAAEIK